MNFGADSSGGSGVYILELPESRSFVEILELRPDMLVAWTRLPEPDDPSPELDCSGGWSMGVNKLDIWLLNEEETEITSYSFVFADGIWVENENPAITLRKRPGFAFSPGPLYIDPR